MKKLLMLGLLVGAFYAGLTFEEDYPQIRATLTSWDTTLRNTFNTVRDAWNTQRMP